MKEYGLELTLLMIVGIVVLFDVVQTTARKRLKDSKRKRKPDNTDLNNLLHKGREGGRDE